jgi:hypothetical protein
MSAHLHTAARRHVLDHCLQRVRPRRPDVQLRVREQHRAQRHAVLADTALLHLPGLGQQLRCELRYRRKHLRGCLSVCSSQFVPS